MVRWDSLLGVWKVTDVICAQGGPIQWAPINLPASDEQGGEDEQVKVL